MNNPAIEALLQAKQKLEAEKAQFLTNINTEIEKIDVAIEQLSGKKVWEVEQEEKYDDENPNYIKTSFEE